MPMRGGELRVLRGRPDEDELTALVVALAVAGRRGPDRQPERPGRPRWLDHGSGYRGPRSWRASGHTVGPFY
jgi:hypothetical protein